MTDLRKAAEMALKFCEDIGDLAGPYPYVNGTAVVSDSRKVLQALRQALAQPVDLAKVGEVGVWGNGDAVNMSQERVDETAKGEHEPVAWLWKNQDGHQVLTDDPDYADGTWTPLYTAPPKREWVGLTDADKQEAFDETQEASGGFWEFADYLDAKLKEKNT